MWCLIGRGEIIDDKGTTNWSVEWVAFREFRETEHPLFEDHDPAELAEAMVVIRSEKMRPPADVFMEQQDADG